VVESQTCEYKTDPQIERRGTATQCSLLVGLPRRGRDKYSSRQHLCATISLLAWCDVRSVQSEKQIRRREKVNTHEWFSAHDFAACSRSDSCRWRRSSDASKRNSHGLPENQDDSSSLLLVRFRLLCLLPWQLTTAVSSKTQEQYNEPVALPTRRGKSCTAATQHTPGHSHTRPPMEGNLWRPRMRPPN
jgi:hypothetical protein